MPREERKLRSKVRCTRNLQDETSQVAKCVTQTEESSLNRCDRVDTTDEQTTLCDYPRHDNSTLRFVSDTTSFGKYLDVGKRPREEFVSCECLKYLVISVCVCVCVFVVETASYLCVITIRE